MNGPNTVLPSFLREAPLADLDYSRSALLPTQPHTQPRSQQGISRVLIPVLLLICAGLRSNFR